ncbi:hypothetical protein EOM39_03880, partial [Candidatus Gracilibacteria bacterium]|nr:hypothetical protein [Candidatus Gracilibacteria bacterium]
TQTWNGTTRAPVKNWSYNAGTCGFLCNANYSRNGSTCAPAVRTYNCGTLSSGKQKNSVSSYTQTWNGTSRSPSNSSYVYNTSSSTTSCRYKCSSGYNRTGSNCIKCNSGYSWDSSVKKCKKTISGNGCSSCPYGYSNGPRYGNCSSSSGNRRYKVCNGLGVTCGLEKSWSFSDMNCNKIENYSWSATIYQ